MPSILKQYKQDQEFLKLEAEAKEAQDRLNAIIIKVHQDFPLGNDRKWGMSSSGTFHSYYSIPETGPRSGRWR